MNRILVEVCPWPMAPDKPVLETNVVHVWSAALAAAPSRVERLWHLLTADEIARAGLFHFQKDRDHFIVARALLRQILSRYLNLEPAELRFRYGAHGKPALATCPADETLRFNLAHSNGVALYAITRGREIGVDLEYVREDFPGFEIAERFFSRGEVGMLRALPPDRRQEAFFTIWTLKEAYLKAQGQGLALGMHQPDVSAFLERSAPSVGAKHDLQELSGWTLKTFAAGCGHIGALAMEGQVAGFEWHQVLEPDGSPITFCPANSRS